MHHSSSTFVYLLSLVCCCVAVSIPTEALLRRHSGGAKALYVLSNQAKNAVVAIKVNADGTLSKGSMTATGGVGMSGINGMTNMTAGPDGIFSQSALRADGNILAAVNPGSNSLSLFTISSSDPTKLTMCGSPASTLGDFPNTVALSAKLGLACAGNTGAKAGVSCFKLSSRGPVSVSKSQITTFDLGQSNPPVGPLNSVSHAIFDEAAGSLVTFVKGDPPTNKTGFVSVLPIKNGKPATTDVRSTPAGTAVLFGVALVPGSSAKKSTILATDAAFGTATLSLDATTNQVSTVNTATIADQVATCWATFSSVTKTSFVTDVAVSHLVEVDPAAGKILQSTSVDITNVGMIDLVTKGKFIYALSPGNQSASGATVVVMKMNGTGKKVNVVQQFVIDGVGMSAQGMTMV